MGTRWNLTGLLALIFLATLQNPALLVGYDGQVDGLQVLHCGKTTLRGTPSGQGDNGTRRRLLSTQLNDLGAIIEYNRFVDMDQRYIIVVDIGHIVQTVNQSLIRK